MFKIESKDNPRVNHRVHMFRNVTSTSVVIKQFDKTIGAYMTNSYRTFESHEEAAAAYNKQRHLLTCIAMLAGPNYTITENEETVSPQLTLEIAA